MRSGISKGVANISWNLKSLAKAEPVNMIHFQNHFQLYPNPNPQGYRQLGGQPVFALQQQPIGPVGMAPLAGPPEPFHRVCYCVENLATKVLSVHRRGRIIASIAVNLDIMMIIVVPSTAIIMVGIEINNTIRRQRTDFIIGTPTCLVSPYSK
jgi:hypothetical protein